MVQYNVDKIPTVPPMIANRIKTIFILMPPDLCNCNPADIRKITKVAPIIPAIT